MLWSDTLPDVNTSGIRFLKPGTIALFRKVMILGDFNDRLRFFN